MTATPPSRFEPDAQFPPLYVAVSRSCLGSSGRTTRAQGQGRGRGAAAGPPPTARASARDTGYWVSIVTEHWHLRMLVPGDYSMLPLTPEARKIADSWTSPRRRQRPISARRMVRPPSCACRVVNIHWTDDNTLQLDTDAGTHTHVQVRRRSAAFRTGPVAARPSVASWEFLGARGRGAALPKGSGRRADDPDDGRILRRNGVPYSENLARENTSTRSPSPTATRGSS